MNENPEHGGDTKREWELQETAASQERQGARWLESPGRLGEYRLVARAARAPLEKSLEENFAASVARTAETLKIERAPVDAAAEHRRLWQWAAAYIATIGLGALVATGANLLILTTEMNAWLWVAATAVLTSKLPFGGRSMR